MDSEVGGHLLDRHTRPAVPRDPHDVLTKLLRIRLGHSDILPTSPTGQASSDVTRSCSRPYTPHSLRHFFASTALAAGIPIHEVSRWLGHRSIKTTVDVYGHLVPASWDRCRTIMQTALRPETPRR
ncbi:tyrosine-type recombinase/integrase [Streptomyces sp. NPDC059017]|uniref:tyrosine-type recombinase/integrase n=1 Tax=Streptomyces sp. NPDC059017 TaxID=3346700 RepID=UPI003699DB4F